MRACRLMHRLRETATSLGKVPAPVALLDQARAARRGGLWQPAIRDRRIGTHEIAGLGGAALRTAIGKVDRPRERRPIEAELLDLLQRKCHL